MSGEISNCRLPNGDLRKNEPQAEAFSNTGMFVWVRYTNWRGETRLRRIVPLSIRYGSTDWHKEQQFLLEVIDLEDATKKEFALKDCDFTKQPPEGWAERAATEILGKSAQQQEQDPLYMEKFRAIVGIINHAFIGDL